MCREVHIKLVFAQTMLETGSWSTFKTWMGHFDQAFNSPEDEQHQKMSTSLIKSRRYKRMYIKTHEREVNYDIQPSS